MKSSDKKGAEDKYFALFTPQNDNKHYTKKRQLIQFLHIYDSMPTQKTFFLFRKKSVSPPTQPLRLGLKFSPKRWAFLDYNDKKDSGL